MDTTSWSPKNLFSPRGDDDQETMHLHSKSRELNQFYAESRKRNWRLDIVEA